MVKLDLLDIYFRNSPDSLNGLGIPGNIWFRRFAVTHTPFHFVDAICCSCDDNKIKMARKLKKIQKENPVGCTGEGKR